MLSTPAHICHRWHVTTLSAGFVQAVAYTRLSHIATIYGISFTTHLNHLPSIFISGWKEIGPSQLTLIFDCNHRIEISIESVRSQFRRDCKLVLQSGTNLLKSCQLHVNHGLKVDWGSLFQSRFNQLPITCKIVPALANLQPTPPTFPIAFLLLSQNKALAS